VPQADLAELLSSADVWIIPSPQHPRVSIPSRLYNLLAVGRAIIVAADPASEQRRVVEGEQIGWVVRAEDPGNWPMPFAKRPPTAPARSRRDGAPPPRRTNTTGAQRLPATGRSSSASRTATGDPNEHRRPAAVIAGSAAVRGDVGRHHLFSLPLLQRYALARPNARSSHRIPTPQGAGIAVIAATLVSRAPGAGLMHLAVPLVMFTATLFIALVGFADDVKSIPVLPRLLLQAAAVGAIVFTAPADLQIVPACPLSIERGVLLIAALWFVNLVNFMDGLD